MTAEREGLAEIAGVLAEHQIVRDDFSPHCSCGLFRDKRDHDQANYRAHLADALADLLAARDRRVRAEAVREAAKTLHEKAALEFDLKGPFDPRGAGIWDAGAYLGDRADRMEADA